MRIAVTGASGHVGGNLVRALLNRGDHVRVFVRPGEVTRSLDGLELERSEGDVRDIESLRRCFQGVDTVFHLAAMISISGDHGGLVSSINVQGPANSARAALETGVRRFVHCSSVHAFNLYRGGLINEASHRSEGAGMGAYDCSKWRGEQEVQRLVAEGLDAVIVNPTGIIGPHDYTPSRMGRALMNLRHRKMPSLVPGGFDWVDVREVVASLLNAEKYGERGHNYLLSGHFKTVHEIAHAVESATGAKAPRMTTPLWAARAAAPFAEAFGRVSRSEPLFTRESLHTLQTGMKVDGAKARSKLSHTPRPFEETGLQ
jgi:dihydroflavonol-4-reductase